MSAPAGYTELDLVGFTDKGDYDSTATYMKNDLTNYNGKKWQCLLDNVMNVIPAVGSTWKIFINIPTMTSSVNGMGKPDNMTAEVNNSGTFSAVGTTIIGFVNPAGTEFGVNWLLDANGQVIVPETRRQYRVNLRNKELFFYWTGTAYAPLGGGGHTVQNTSGTALEQRDNMQFKDMSVSDDSTNNKTVIQQTYVVSNEQEWNQLIANHAVNDNVTYYLPWSSKIYRKGKYYGDITNLVERIIAPLEDNPATVAYQTGRQIIYNDHLYEVIQNIGVGDILIAYEDDPTNANIKLAAPVETQVLALNGRMGTAEDDIDALETGKADNSVIAPVESGTTASRSYAAGTHFIRDSAFCTAKTAIAQGEAFTLNTNYTAGTVAQTVKDIPKIQSIDYDINLSTYPATISAYGFYFTQMIEPVPTAQKILSIMIMNTTSISTYPILFNIRSLKQMQAALPYSTSNGTIKCRIVYI